ncbi:hypothetical protein FACS189413_04460 [Bacteroidia bacterium]|nr:hypothetical protein FACS189413_04460 [Bacteroidia bacterium]
MEVDLTNPYLRIEAVAAKDSVTGSMERISDMANRKSKPGYEYIAGINADFFDMDNGTGRPYNGSIYENQIGTKPPAGAHIVFAGKQPVIDNVEFSGYVIHKGKKSVFSTVNDVRGAHKLVFYNQLNGTHTHTDTSGTEVELQLQPDETWGFNKPITAQVVKIEQSKGNMLIPKGEVVLSGNGLGAAGLSSMTEGDEVTLHLDLTFAKHSSFSIGTDISSMLGARHTLWNLDGLPYENIILYNGVAYEVEAANHPRTGAGYSIDGKKLIFCVADGRSTISQGCFTKELADMLKSMGAWNGLCFDGGGSSEMWIKQLGGVVNVPSDGHERAIGNALFIVADDRPDAIPEIATEPEIRVYPNPVINEVHIESNVPINSIEFCNATGKRLLSDTTHGRKHIVSLNRFPQGIYILKMDTGNKIIIRKLIKH